MTAVEWLYDKLKLSLPEDMKDLRGLVVIALEMEKEQKELDYQSGFLDCYTKLNSEQLTRKI